MMRGSFFVHMRRELGETVYTWRLQVNGKIYALTRWVDKRASVNDRRMMLAEYDREFLRDIGKMEPNLDRLGRIARAIYPEPIHHRMMWMAR